MLLSIPRDRAGTFDSKPIAKYQRRFPEFDDKIYVHAWNDGSRPPWGA
jgi:transposase-like protein